MSHFLMQRMPKEIYNTGIINVNVFRARRKSCRQGVSKQTNK